ncbi:MAG: adenylosuccinate lyase [Actinobacteria bacterium RBG_16_64_13]|nr:MAG: adenylosuccinate lyase [Actinobacteria bacterium RBG_16_64_13]
MIERYSTPEMSAIWTDQARMAAWLQVELAVCEAWTRLGQIPEDALAQIKDKAAFDVDRVCEIEQVTQHDVIAFVSCVAENVGECSKYIHYGLTSSDVLDTGLALQMRAAGALLQEETKKLGGILQRRALEHRDTVMIGRTHGIHAEPITFGMVLGLWAFEIQRGLERLQRAVQQISVGKISGAVGSYANVDPQVEQIALSLLDLGVAPISTQIVQRDRHAEFMSALALLASSLEKIALQVRHYQRTEVLEAEEYFAPGQKGSSAMPHKRNPIISERLCGQARIIRGNMVAAFENIALWHERDISHSSAERIILPDSTILLHYMLKKACWLIDKLNVYPGNMAANMDKSFGLLYSQRVLLALVEAGMLRDDAYAVVQRSAMRAWEEKISFLDLLRHDPEVADRLSIAQLDACFDPAHQLRNMGVIFDRVAALKW